MNFISPGPNAGNMTPLSAPLAPDQPAELTAQARLSSKTGPDVVQYRDPVERTVGVPAWRSISAGAELGRMPMTFDIPNRLRDIYRGLRGAMRTTMLAPELQSEIGTTDASVMVAKGMNPPYKINEPGPWYSSFVATLG